MDRSSHFRAAVRLAIVLSVACFMIVSFVTLEPFQASPRTPSLVATYSQGLLRLTIPYNALHLGAGQLTMEVLDPEDHVVGRSEQRVEVTEQRGQWQDEIRFDRPLRIDDLVRHRLRYRLEYDDVKIAAFEGTESISQILRRPVVHILGQQSYLTGGQAAARVIVTDSKEEVIAGRGSVRIELLAGDDKTRILFSGRLNRRGTTEAQFQFPAGMVGNYRLRSVVDTPLGSTNFTQDVRLKIRSPFSSLRKSPSTNPAR